MKRWGTPVLAATLAWAFSGPGFADMQCHDLVEGAQYCSTAEVGPTFVSEVLYPDILFNFHVSQDPLITSIVIAMPIDREITSWQDIQNMVFDQVMVRGSARFYEIRDIDGRASTIDGENSMQLDYIGYNSGGRVAAVSIVDATPLGSHVLMVITTDEGLETVTPELRGFHQRSIDSITGIGL